MKLVRGVVVLQPVVRKVARMSDDHARRIGGPRRKHGNHGDARRQRQIEDDPVLVIIERKVAIGEDSRARPGIDSAYGCAGAAVGRLQSGEAAARVEIAGPA